MPPTGRQNVIRTQRWAAFGFGVIFIVVLLILAFFFPYPTPFQYIVFRIVLAIAVAGVAAMVPGFLEIEIPNWIRAGGALAVFVIVYFYNPASRVTQSSNLESIRGQFSGKILDADKPYTLNFGNNFRVFRGAILKKGVNLADLSAVKISNVKIPVKLYDEGNRLLVDAILYDAEGKVICQIVRNNWEVNLKDKYDRNYSINAFEIIDSENIPVFQVYLSETNNIFFGGYFYDNHGKRWFYTPERITDMKFPPKRIFKYPSSRHIGQLEDRSNLPKFLTP